MSRSHPQSTTASRRRFLRDTLALGAGAATVALTPASVAAVAEQPREIAPSSTPKKGYRLTPHVADYYKTAAF